MNKNNHTPPPSDLDLKNALHEERHLFEKAEVPIVTVSATYRKELADKYKSVAHTHSDVIFSRAHYSMAEAVYQQAVLEGKISIVSDPTNFVSESDWKKIEFTEKVGKLIARNRLLKSLKEKMDSFVRGSTPISKSIYSPLLYLTGKTKCPIISMHYETGNILAKLNKTVIQAITDPHVHPQYLEALPTGDITFAVFDNDTKLALLREAKKLGKKISDDQIVVTGAFIDHRINTIGKVKGIIKKDEPVNIAVTTGGLGTNLDEIKEILENLKSLLTPPEEIRLFLYAGTHRDFRNFFEDFARDNHIRIGNLDDENARIRILYDDSIIDANENLIKYMFPWADGVITKPSGDMAYDAAAAGCFLLFLEPWGVWEENIQKIFVNRKIGFDFEVGNSLAIFERLKQSDRLSKAMQNTKNLPATFREGCKNLIDFQQTLPCITE